MQWSWGMHTSQVWSCILMYASRMHALLVRYSSHAHLKDAHYAHTYVRHTWRSQCKLRKPVHIFRMYFRALVILCLWQNSCIMNWWWEYTPTSSILHLICNNSPNDLTMASVSIKAYVCVELFGALDIHSLQNWTLDDVQGERRSIQGWDDL